jgi:hypothetical protein
MNYDSILSAILMDLKLAAVAVGYFLAIGFLIAASIVLEKTVRNLRGKWRERHARTAAQAGTQPRVLEFVSSSQAPTGAAL